MPGGLLYLFPDQIIKYQKAIQTLNDLINTANSYKAHGSGAIAKSILAPSGDDSNSSTLTQISLSALFGGGGRSKAEEIRRRSEAVAENSDGNRSAADSSATASESSNVDDAIGDERTVEKLESDAIRQINASILSDALIETVSDEYGNDILISQKEKAQRDIARLVRSNKQNIANGTFSIDQLAMQIYDVLLKKGVAYNTPIASKAFTGYKRKEKIIAPMPGNGSAEPTLSVAQQALMLRAKKAGLTLEEYKQKREKEEQEQAAQYSAAADISLKQQDEARKSGQESSVARAQRIKNEYESLINQAMKQIEEHAEFSDEKSIPDPNNDGHYISSREIVLREFKNLIKAGDLKANALLSESTEDFKRAITAFLVLKNINYSELVMQSVVSQNTAGGSASTHIPKKELTAKQQENQQRIQQNRDEADARILGVSVEVLKQMPATDRNREVNKRKIEIKEAKEAAEFGMSIKQLRQLSQAEKAELHRSKMQQKRDEKTAAGSGISVEELRATNTAKAASKAILLDEIIREERRKVEEKKREEEEGAKMEKAEADTRGISLAQLRQNQELQRIKEDQKLNGATREKEKNRRKILRGNESDAEDDEASDDGWLS